MSIVRSEVTMGYRFRLACALGSAVLLSSCTPGGRLIVTVISSSAIRIALADSRMTRDGCIGSGYIQRTERLDGPLVDGPPAVSFAPRRNGSGECRRAVTIGGTGPTEMLSGAFPLSPGSYRVSADFGPGSAWGDFVIP